MDDQSQDILTEEELAERWKCSAGTLRNRRRKGSGPPWFRPLGETHGPVRYRLRDIERWEASRLEG